MSKRLRAIAWLSGPASESKVDEVIAIMNGANPSDGDYEAVLAELVANTKADTPNVRKFLDNLPGEYIWNDREVASAQFSRRMVTDVMAGDLRGDFMECEPYWVNWDEPEDYSRLVLYYSRDITPTWADAVANLKVWFAKELASVRKNQGDFLQWLKDAQPQTKGTGRQPPPPPPP